MAFQPKILNPTPDPAFVRELKKIDPDLRVVWGYERYLTSRWVIERKIQPERYFLLYENFLTSGAERFVEQPIFDTNQYEYDEEGAVIGYKKIGTRKYDLAPDYEWVLSCDRLAEPILVQLRRAYAWERNQPLSRLKYEKEQEQAKKAEAESKLQDELIEEGFDEAWRELRKKVVFGRGQTRKE